MTNVAWSRLLLEKLAAVGVQEIILCAGARNAPLVAVLSQVEGLKVHGFFEERSAGFFAIGRMQAEARPVVVCTTSGTAVAELLPAVVEAHYQSLPLIVVSADRPKSYRGSGAPQTIVQPGIFSSYVETSWDLDPNSAVPEFSVGREPLHLNVCFDEPLIDEHVTPWTVVPINFCESTASTKVDWHLPVAAENPLIILGRLSRKDAAAVAPILQKWRRPVYAEGLSHLRGVLGEVEILEESIAHLKIDGVIRIGEVPTLRFWRDLEKSALPVWHFSAGPFSGLPRCKDVFPLSALGQVRAQFQAWSSEEKAQDQKRSVKLNELIHEFPLSECAWVRRVSEWIPKNSCVLLGNSLPIREWDLAAVRTGQFTMFGNRGTNGIDGLISTFLGIACEKASNWAIIGDLSALYDLTGPWALRNRDLKDINLVVINNGGGKIFERIFKNNLFENPHQLKFGDWAKMWGLQYQQLQSAADIPAANNGPRVLEIVPDAGHTRAFCEAWEKMKC